MGPEAGLRARVLRAIRHTPGTRFWGWPASAFTGAGHPDLFGLLHSKFVAFELKTATGRPTKRQIVELRAIRKAGGYAWIVRTVEQAVAALQYVATGAHPPMADQPLDIDDFFASLDAPTAAAPATEEPEVLPWEDESTPPGEAQSHEELLADLDARDDALNGKTPTVADVVAARDAQIGIDSDADLVAALNMIAQFSEKLDKDVRASGDRVTTVFEEIHSLRLELNVMRNIVQAQERATRQLIALISDGEELPVVPIMPEPEPAPEPIAPRRRSRRAS
ncbi:MAG TPA: hypothetical protein VFB50_01090 [Chloroflexota bacterium]|nr:hypothetical protein [Chloroflexota bacterium]